MKLKEVGDFGGIDCLNRLLNEMTNSTDEKMQDEKVEDRNFRKLTESTPRRLIEELYYIGLSEGVDKSTGANYLKMADDLLNIRLSLSSLAVNILDSQIVDARRYYGMIKEYGGFQRFNLREKPQIQIVDLDLQAKQDEEEAKRKETLDKLNDIKSAVNDDMKANIETQEKSDDVADSADAVASPSIPGDSGDTDDQNDDLRSGSFGPIMM